MSTSYKYNILNYQHIFSLYYVLSIYFKTTYIIHKIIIILITVIVDIET